MRFEVHEKLQPASGKCRGNGCWRQGRWVLVVHEGREYKGLLPKHLPIDCSATENAYLLGLSVTRGEKNLVAPQHPARNGRLRAKELPIEARSWSRSLGWSWPGADAAAVGGPGTVAIPSASCGRRTQEQEQCKTVAGQSVHSSSLLPVYLTHF